MTILKFLQFPDPRLRQPGERVHKVSASVLQLVQNMWETLHVHHCVGLAATQFGVMKQVCVLDPALDDPEAAHALLVSYLPRPLVLLNPRIVQTLGTVDSPESNPCLPGQDAVVQRFEAITVRYQDLKSKSQQLSLTGGSLLCRAIQHEVDHLNGMLFIDRKVT